jgi:hypothetical protein
VLVRVEVFPISPDGWIVVVEESSMTGISTPVRVDPDRWRQLLGGFSAQFATARGVPQQAQSELKDWLGVSALQLDLVDDRGRPWSPRDAPAQVERLAVRYRPGQQAPDPRWRRGLLGRQRLVHEECPVCAHQWREHTAGEGECGECAYEISHADPDAPTATCHVMPPGSGVTEPRR